MGFALSTIHQQIPYHHLRYQQDHDPIRAHLIFPGYMKKDT